MPQLNAQLAAMFERMADVLQLLDANKFKVNAYQRAARSLETLEDDLAQMDEAQMKKIPGLGASMVAHIREYLDTGRIAEFDELTSQIPAGVFELLDVPGLGPKTVALFWKDAGVDSVAALKKALATGELESLPRMGRKKLEGIAKSLAFMESAGDRTRIDVAMPLAEWIVDQLKGLPGVERIDFAGSLRRGQETIGDIDILVAADAPHAPQIAEAFTQLPIVADVIAHGQSKCSIRTTQDAGRMQVDLRLVPPGSYGAALMYFTGSKEHNVRLRERAIAQGMTLNEYGLWREDAGDAAAEGKKKAGQKDAERLVAADTEEHLYEALGLPWIAPPLREDRGELKLAEAGELPRLIELGDIKAELHAHTHASDGSWSIEQLARAAADRGFHTVAVTDHSKSSVQANGLSIDRLHRHIDAVHAVAKKLQGVIAVLAGSEVDILGDGTLDYPDEVLARLDVVVASPHVALSQEPDKATARLLKALENPYVHILGHPTGRLVGRRPGLSPDIKQLVKAAAEHGVALEINANGYRLDLRDTHAKLALDAGCMLAIDTDAHGLDNLDQLRYGVLTAQRAGATAQQVINCLDAAALRRWLRLKTQP